MRELASPCRNKMKSSISFYCERRINSFNLVALKFNLVALKYNELNFNATSLNFNATGGDKFTVLRRMSHKN
jgi:hypothetical protein